MVLKTSTQQKEQLAYLNILFGEGDLWGARWTTQGSTHFVYYRCELWARFERYMLDMGDYGSGAASNRFFYTLSLVVAPGPLCAVAHGQIADTFESAAELVLELWKTFEKGTAQ